MKKILSKTLPWWNEWREDNNEQVPDFRKMKSLYDLPSLLHFNDGTEVKSTQDWHRRKKEIWDLLTQYFFGQFPEKNPVLKKAVLLKEEGEPGFVRNKYELYFDIEPEVSFTIEIMKPEGKGPFPVFLTQTNHRAWGIVAVSRGYLACIYPGADGNDQSSKFNKAYPNCDWTTIPRRAWLASRTLDFLYTLEEVEQDKIGITGHSRNGKQSLIATAIDKRINAVISSSSGAGGICPFRLTTEADFGESVEFITRNFPDWFHPRLRFFTGREDKLPIDIHGLLALIAPRPCLISTALNDTSGDISYAVEKSFQEGQKAYDFLNEPENIKIRWRDGNHELCAEDIQAYIDWFDSVFFNRKLDFKQKLLYNFDWERWKNNTEIDNSKMPKFIESTSSKKKIKNNILWTLGNKPAVVTNWRDKYGAEREYLSLKLNRPQTPTGVNRMRFQFSTYVSGDLYYPEHVQEPLSIVIWLHPYSYSSGYTGSYRTEEPIYHFLAQKGFGVLAFDQIGFGRRIREGSSFYNRYPYWSQLGQMIQDVQGAIDFLLEGEGRFELANDNRFQVSLPPINYNQIYCVGYSLGGMVALFAAALDCRITGVASVCGLMPLDESTDKDKQIHRLRSWYKILPRMVFYYQENMKIPYNYEHILSLVAPRPALVVAPEYDRETNINMVKNTVKKASNSYQNLGAEEKLTLLTPADYNRFQLDQHQIILEWLQKNME